MKKESYDKLTSLSTEKMTLVQTYEGRVRNLIETIKLQNESEQKKLISQYKKKTKKKK